MFGSYIKYIHVQLHDDCAREMCIEHTIIYMMTGKSEIKNVKVMGLCPFFEQGVPGAIPLFLVAANSVIFPLLLPSYPLFNCCLSRAFYPWVSSVVSLFVL